MKLENVSFAVPHDVFELVLEFFLLKIFLISYSSRPYTQNRSASKAESYMKLRLEGLSDNLIRALALTGSIKASNFIN